MLPDRPELFVRCVCIPEIPSYISGRGHGNLSEMILPHTVPDALTKAGDVTITITFFFPHESGCRSADLLIIEILSGILRENDSRSILAKLFERHI